MAEESRPVRANTGMIVQPNHTFDDCPPLFMLLIPGGSTSVLTENPRVMAWVAEQEKQVEHLVSVCTGAMVLAELGLLDGLEATTHYGSYDRLQEAAPKAVVRRDVRVADNGHIVTGAGVSAGIDLALHMIARLSRDAGGPRRGRVHDVPLGRRRPGPRRGSDRVLTCLTANAQPAGSTVGPCRYSTDPLAASVVPSPPSLLPRSPCR